MQKIKFNVDRRCPMVSMTSLDCEHILLAGRKKLFTFFEKWLSKRQIGTCLNMSRPALFSQSAPQQIDDVVDAVPVHFACGAWGVFSASLFATKDNCECLIVSVEPWQH